MKAIIPAAGYATRMYPLTLNQPKTLLLLGSKPILEHIIGQILVIPGVDEIIVVSNSKFYKNFLDWRKKFHCSVPIKIIDDKTSSSENRLGAIGDISLAIESEKINEDIVIVNSDNIFTFNLFKAYKFFKKKDSNAICLFDVKNFDEAKKMGVAEFDKDGKVIDFVEKPLAPKTTLVSIGIYFYTKKTVPFLRIYLDEGNSPDRTGDFLEWLYKKADIFVFPFSGGNDHWFDIGEIEMFEQVKKDFPKLEKVIGKRASKQLWCKK